MRNAISAAALAALVAVGACSIEATMPEALCTGDPAVQAHGAFFTAVGPAAATEAGPLYVVVTREHTGCQDGTVTVTDSAAPSPSLAWVDGDAFRLSAGTPVYVRVGTPPGQELVAERAPGEWIRLVLLYRKRD